MHTPWHTISAPRALEELGASEEGLTSDEALRRLKEHGQNVLPEPKTDGVFLLFLRQFKSPLIYVLLGAAAAVYAIGETVDAVLIFAVLFFNAVVGSVQEGRAQNTLLALRRFTATRATVLRDGNEVIISDREVVPGDIMFLHEGQKVSADARVLSSQNLKADEASMTGESAPVHKMPDTLSREELPPAEQFNMLFRGTNIVSGSGRALVVATGTETAIGKIAQQIASIHTEMPLQADIRFVSRIIIGAAALVCSSIFVGGLSLGFSVKEMFAIAVSMAVSVIPEGLPIVLTLVLATGVWRMSKRNALVKRLQAIEALGQARIIAVDKTGTITRNELVVKTVWTNTKRFEVQGVGYDPKGGVELEGSSVDAANHEELLFAGKVAALCASARLSYSEEDKRWNVAGDPTEAALLVFSEKMGFHRDELLHEAPLIEEMPFDYRLKYHAVVNEVEGEPLLCVVGAPEVVIERCKEIREGGRNRPLSKEEKEELETQFARLSEEGLRVVAFATAKHVKGGMKLDAVAGLSFGGFWGMTDALRPEVAEAMQRSVEAGIRVVMITGDHKLTARAIAQGAGIYREGDRVLSGADIDKLSDEELMTLLPSTTVFARVTPEHKLRIVQVFKKRGEIIAMTGDGVNDAPSLVAADLGVAMGGIGTEVAKEAADIVLLDDNFGSIVSAVEEGRSIYQTIKKVMLYLFSTSLGEVLTIGGALLLGLPLPLMAAQIIWLNFVTDGFLDVALAMEPREKGLLSGRFSRPKRYIVDALMGRRMIVMALPMAVGALALFARELAIEPEKALTMSLTTLAVFQWFNAWNCRSHRESIFQMNPFSNPFLVGATGVVVVLQLLAVYTPFLQNLLHTVPLSLNDWLLIIPIAASIIVAEELRKLFYRLRHPVGEVK